MSNANGLTTNDHNGLTLDLFLRHVATGETTMITRGLNGAGASGDSYSPFLSADGRWVVFESAADDLVEGDANEGTDVFVFDRQNGATSLVSQTGESGGEGEAKLLTVSADGRFVVFSSTADDIAANDTNLAEDIFVWYRESEGLELVTKNWQGTKPALGAPAGGSVEAAVSPDGRYVAHIGLPRDLVRTAPAALTNEAQLLLWDRVKGTNVLISPLVADATQINAITASAPVFSGNGAKLAFLSENRARNTAPQLWIYTLASGELKSVPAPFAAIGAQPGWSEPAFNADGSLVTAIFDSQVVLHEFTTGLSTLVSASASGAPGDAVSSTPLISSNGNVIVFTSIAGNLVNGLSTSDNQFFMFDRAATNLSLLSRARSGTGGANAEVNFTELSLDGRAAAFVTSADNLADNDTSRVNDVFIADLAGTNGVALLSAAHPSSISATADGTSRVETGALSLDGRYLVFTSDANDLVAGVDDAHVDLYLRELRTGETRQVNGALEGSTNSSFAGFSAISANGSVVLYTSSEALPSGTVTCLVAYDTASGSRTIASILPDGTIAPRASGASISADGRYAAFVSGLTSSGTACLRDLKGLTTRVITTATATGAIVSPGGRYVLTTASGNAVQVYDRLNPPPLSAAPLRSFVPTVAPFSFDGQKLFLLGVSTPGRFDRLYEFSPATLVSNLIATNLDAPVLVTPTGTTAVSLRRAPEGTNVAALDLATGAKQTLKIFGETVSRLRATPSSSADGRFLTLSVTNGASVAEPVAFTQVILYDLWQTNATLLSRSLEGVGGNAPATSPTISADGRIVVFDGLASDLVPNDRNGMTDVFLARIGTADTNGNGLDDGWESHYSLTGATAAGDADGDGASNAQEFLAGTNPSSAASVFEVLSAHSMEPASTVLNWMGILGKSYQVQQRASLSEGEWTNVGTPHLAIGNGEISHVQAHSGGSAFYRVVLFP